MAAEQGQNVSLMNSQHSVSLNNKKVISKCNFHTVATFASILFNASKAATYTRTGDPSKQLEKADVSSVSPSFRANVEGQTIETSAS